MTHEELIIKLWEKRNALCDNLDIHFALSAVVELHKPEIRYAPEPFCAVCYTEGQPYEQADDVPYPCPTIKAIEAVIND
jgi:hypothetical protein